MVQRSDRQNRALHLWLRKVADSLNAAGLDQRTVLKPGVSIPWTPKAAKENLWRPIQKAMFAKRSTAELSKGEVGEVEQVLVRHLADRFHFESPAWPHYEDGEHERITSSTNDAQSL